MTSSTQVVSNVPCGVKSSGGVVYVAVAGARPGADRAYHRLHVRREQRAVRDDVLVRELLSDRREDGLELLRGRTLDVRAVRRIRDALERLGVVLGRLQADRDDADVGVVQSGDRVLTRCLDEATMSVREQHGSRAGVALLLGQARRLDEGVVDARAFCRLRGLRDGRGQLARIRREVGEHRHVAVVGDDCDGQLVLALRHERPRGRHGGLDRLAGHAVRRVDQQDRAARLRAAVDREPGDAAAVLRDVEALAAASRSACGTARRGPGTRSPAPR